MKSSFRFRPIVAALLAGLCLLSSVPCLRSSDMPLALTKPMPFDEAVARVDAKTPIASALTTAQWQEVAIGLRDRAFFSAQVADIRTVATMQAKVQEALDLSSRDAGRAFMDKDKFIADMREQLGAAEGDSGSLTDLTSSRRLGLVYDFNVEDAMEAGRFQVAQDPELLDAFPAQELFRLEEREAKREWTSIWQAAGGTVYPGERMIARKDDRIWYAISDFGRPWPPFKFGSGMGIEDVDRDEAEALKILGPDDVVKPQDVDFNQGLQASLPEASPATLEGFKNIFGDQVDVGLHGEEKGKVTWQGDRIGKLYEEALANPASKWSLDLGAATVDTVAMAEQAGVDLTGARLHLTADDIRHANNRHGAESGSGDLALAARDFKLVPHVWRDPDRVVAGGKPGSLLLEKKVAGQLVVVAYDRLAKTPKWGVKTLYKTKEKGPA